MRDDNAGAKTLVAELYHRFHTAKTYGKEPEALESITKVFLRDFASFSAEEVMRAISIHSQRSSEFPTPHDIYNLITRKGAKPQSDAMYVALNKKPREELSKGEWKYIHEFEEERLTGTDFPDPVKIEATQSENRRLRSENRDLREEIERLTVLLQKQQREQMKAPVIFVDKNARTIEHMRATGSSEAEIEEFIQFQSEHSTT